MSKDAEVQEVIELIKALHIQQTALISPLERLSAERKERRTTTATPRAVPTVIAPRAYQIGDEVRILNPRRLQPSKGRLIKIGVTRITVKASNRNTIVRAPKNITYQEYEWTAPGEQYKKIRGFGTHGLGTVPDESIVIETWSKPPVGSIPSEPRLSTSIVIDIDDDGADEPSSEPPGLGLILSEPHLSTSIAIDLDDDDGIAAIPSEPPGHGSHLSSSIDDGIGS